MEEWKLSRWQRARRSTRGFRAVRRELLGTAVTGVLTVVAIFGAGGAWQDALIGLGCAVVSAALLIPGAELVWNFLQADTRLLFQHIELLHREIAALNETVPDKSSSKRPINVKLTLLNFIRVGRERVNDPMGSFLGGGDPSPPIRCD